VFRSDATVEELFFRVSDQGFIGETEARLQVVHGELSARGSGGKLVLGVSCEECFCEERIYV
jgi:hypothetical protein